MDKKIFNEIVVTVKKYDDASVLTSFSGDYGGAGWEQDDAFEP